jgi:hypothetical protein
MGPWCRKPAVYRHIRVEPVAHVLLAMQKVEGSNPFSCFQKGPANRWVLASLRRYGRSRCANRVR